MALLMLQQAEICERMLGSGKMSMSQRIDDFASATARNPTKMNLLFDDFARALVTPMPRRQLFRVIVGILVSFFLATIGAQVAEAQGKTGCGGSCNGGGNCISGICTNKVCACATGYCCCSNGSCVSTQSLGGSCKSC